MKNTPSLWRILGVVLMSVSVAFAVRMFFHKFFDETIPYTPFYPAIIVSTMYGRLRGGLIGVVVASFAAAIWVSPIGRLSIEEATDLIGMGLFICVSALIVALCEGMLRARQRAEEAGAEQQRLLRSEQVARRTAEDANRLKDEFLAMVSHELRTPLHSILGWTQLLQKPELDADTRAHGLQVIERNSHAQARLIEDLLDVGRIVAGKMRLARRLVNPRAVIESAIHTVADAAQARDIRIVREFDEAAHTLSVDPDRYQQIAWNLLSNAIKFSPAGSTVTVGLHRMQGTVRLQVIDHGCGIPADALPHVFERFHQVHSGASSRHGGLGLGLAIVKSLVELHGGTVRADSSGPDQGTTMTVELPCVQLPAKSGDSSTARLAGVRVLVVDDDPEALDLVRRVLEEQDAEVVVADNGANALDVLSQSATDVIVSDISMPQVDGYQMLREFRTTARDEHVPAVALTARCSDEDRARAYAAGYELHLSKPVNPRRLAEAVAELACTRN